MLILMFVNFVNMNAEDYVFEEEYISYLLPNNLYIFYAGNSQEMLYTFFED